VTLEAFYAGKPVLTCRDSGGVLDFVTDHQTGRIVEPDSRSIAAAIDELADHRAQTVAWGAAAREHIHDLDINWPATVKRLVA
jgi:glycosyltransferase involved in cell wall biosynthesis